MHSARAHCDDSICFNDLLLFSTKHLVCSYAVTYYSQCHVRMLTVCLQASWYLQNLLYNVCEEINRIGGHALQRSTLVKLSDQLSDGILQCHQKLLDSKNESETNDVLFTQNRALQLWFDIRFLSFIFPRKDDSQVSSQRGI